VLAAGGDLRIFSTIAEAERYMEPVDVTNGEYVCYDSEGRLLAVRVDPRERVSRTVVSNRYGVTVSAGQDEPRHANELRSALLAFLAKVRHEEARSNEHRSIEELLARVSAIS
jgi:hypothetical protein